MRKPTVHLTKTKRKHISILAHLGLWPKYKIAEAYSVSPATVSHSIREWPAPLPWCHPETETRDERSRSVDGRLSAGTPPNA